MLRSLVKKCALSVKDEAPSREKLPSLLVPLSGEWLGSSFHLGLCLVLVTACFLGAHSQHCSLSAPFIKSPVAMNIGSKSSLVPYAEVAKFLC